MEDEIQKLSIIRVTEKDRNTIEDLVTRELPLTIILNNQELVTLLCSPKNLKYLAVGFLSSEGLIKGKDEIKSITLDDKKGVVRIQTQEDTGFSNELIFKRFITSGCGKGASFYSVADLQGQTRIESQMTISAREILNLVREFQHRSQIYRTTGGVHSAALCDRTGSLVFAEDIGRHNAIDKIFGQCLLEDMPTDEHLIVTSGRISSEILLKVAKRNIPILISKSAPTDLGVSLADELGITLIGFVRGKRMNVYTHDWRVKTNAE